MTEHQYPDPPLVVQTESHHRKVSVSDVITDVKSLPHTSVEEISSKEIMTSQDEIFSKDEPLPISTSRLFALDKPRSKLAIEEIVDDMLGYQTAISRNEIMRSNTESVIKERNQACKHKTRRLDLNNVIQFPYFGEYYDEFQKIAYAQASISPGENISIETHLASVIGQYMGTRMITGSDEGFWEHNERVSRRKKRQDYGVDILGMSVDFKTSMLKHDSMSRNLSLLDYTTTIKPFNLERKESVYIQMFVAFLRKEPCAMVYLTGWALGNDFPEKGAVVRNNNNTGYLKEMHTLFQYQLAPWPPIPWKTNKLHVEDRINHLSGAKDAESYKYFFDNYNLQPWLDFVITDTELHDDPF